MVRWYRAAPEAKYFPFPIAFASSNWADDAEKCMIEVGELPFADALWSNGKTPVGANGQRFCGTRDQWQNGFVYDPTLPRPRQGINGLLLCCNSLAIVGSLGLVAAKPANTTLGLVAQSPTIAGLGLVAELSASNGLGLFPSSPGGRRLGLVAELPAAEGLGLKAMLPAAEGLGLVAQIAAAEGLGLKAMLPAFVYADLSLLAELPAGNGLGMIAFPPADGGIGFL